MSLENQTAILVQLTGGLGNQLFGVAAGLGVARRLGLPLALDVSKFFSRGEIRSGGLDPCELPFRTVGQVSRNGEQVEFKVDGRRIATPVVEEASYRFDPTVAERCANGAHLVGYFQSYKYFENVASEVRTLFRRAPKHGSQGLVLKQRIADTESVGIHVRRGDYLKSPHFEFHGLCGIHYYERAIEIMREKLPNPTFFVFSDDLDWCRENIRGCDVIFSEDGGSPNVDLDLLAGCKHHITSNSSFSWWGAWLGQTAQQSVIAPCPWYTRIPLVPDKLPPTWNLLHRATGEAWDEWERRISATRVSVIVPTHRRVAPLTEAVQSALGQSHQNLDVTIVLSAATAEVKEEASRLQQVDSRVNVVLATSAGPSAARNTGAGASTGEWIAFLDDDDVWFPDKIRTQLTAAIAFDAQAVSCEHAFSGPGLERFKYPPNNQTLREALVVQNFFSGGSAAIVSRGAFENAGGFEESLRGFEDQDLWRRLSLHNPLMIVAEPLLEIRRLDESNSFDSLMMLQSQVQHLVKAIRESPSDLNPFVALAIRHVDGQLKLLAKDRGLVTDNAEVGLRQALRQLLGALVRRAEALPAEAHRTCATGGAWLVAWWYGIVGNGRRRRNRKVSG